jgi:integrase
MPSPQKSPGVRRVRKRLADGTIKTYEYHHPPVSRGKSPALPPDSLRDLLAAYQRSPEWAALAPRTVKGRAAALRHLDEIKHLAVADLRRRHILELRDGIAAGIGPGAANAFSAALTTMFAWARDRGWIEHSPADRIRALPGGHFPTWAEADLTRALDVAPPAIRRALLLAVHTGQRRGDLVAARWSDMAGGAWRLTQEKTKRRLTIPLHPALAAEMATWRKTAVTVLTTEAGTPWDRDGLTMALMRALTPIGLKGHNLHGLRKLAAVRLAEAGCSAHEIAAITGHSSLDQVALYTREADQARLAKAAILRLQKNQDETA